ncbi:hypothetical protein RCL_jg10129.t1 [Rhizophagus clarus]|uniref:Uncharacterized protein n=1 Tax=Rhizophagus clarus TaxID=94130 RepID=A0A8H3KRK3_9GLOM|nr:hypothetical protein RCL_jg10129.t1 [Rhizophagus clarus]
MHMKNNVGSNHNSEVLSDKIFTWCNDSFPTQTELKILWWSYLKKSRYRDKTYFPKTRINNTNVLALILIMAQKISCTS